MRGPLILSLAKKNFLGRGHPFLHPSTRAARRSTLAPRLALQMQFLDPPMYLAKIAYCIVSRLVSVPWKSFYVDNHVVAVIRACNYHTRALRHMREHLTTETAQTPAALSCHGLQLTAVWRSCCSRREAAESSKQRRPGHLSAAQMYSLDSYYSLFIGRLFKSASSRK